MLPKHLIYVRHGQSERNQAGKLAYEKGDMTLFEEVINRPSSQAVLTPLGETQAQASGEWLRAQGFRFERWYTSSYNRAKQTAGLLRLPEAQWFIENNIRERSGGVLEDMSVSERKEYLSKIRNRAPELDLFNFKPERGESYADVTIRLRLFLDTVHRECGDMEAVIVVNHGDNMWVARSLHERWTPEQFVEIRGHNGAGKIPNGMILHYTRINPETGEEMKYVGWVRTCCPWKNPEPTPWQPIIRRRYSSDELLSQVAASVAARSVAQAS